MLHVTDDEATPMRAGGGNQGGGGIIVALLTVLFIMAIVPACARILFEIAQWSWNLPTTLSFV